MPTGSTVTDDRPQPKLPHATGLGSIHVHFEVLHTIDTLMGPEEQTRKAHLWPVRPNARVFSPVLPLFALEEREGGAGSMLRDVDACAGRVAG